MTPKEKAVELHEKMFANCRITMSGAYHIFRQLAVGLAIIAVDEILFSFNSFMDSRRHMRHELEIDAERYWQEVKVELENMKTKLTDK